MIIIKGNPKTRSRKIEILSPAGSFTSFRAAIFSGADAVYAGGNRFGARAFAENFSDQELLEAIDYAHLHGKKFYLTVNTLIKEHEFPELHRYLEPLYRGGLDAVIVQDIGVVSYIRECFPELEIHASTQMTITGTPGARFLQNQGVTRVVPARELSLEEIRHMKAETGMEIECFVHGALCYCYSGQCLMSSLIGGRSGNRGQCAQPCRLPYSAEGSKGYLLSMKDICTLDLIPDFIEAGIDSFKIEGRMKKPEYVAGVTSMYRKYTDIYLQNGREGYKVSSEDKEQLMDLFNRGGFHTGYYFRKNGREMITWERPNHAGVAAVVTLSQKGREITGKALTDLYHGDVIEFSGLKENSSQRKDSGQIENYTFGRDFPKGSMVTLPAPKGYRAEAGKIFYRIRSRRLVEQLSSLEQFGKIKEKIYGILKLSAGKPVTLTVWHDNGSASANKENMDNSGAEIRKENENRTTVTVFSDIPAERAEKSPLNPERIRKQIEKTGNTEFEFVNLEILMEGEVFLPMQQFNELRRKALDELDKKIRSRYHREPEKHTLFFENKAIRIHNNGCPEEQTESAKSGVNTVEDCFITTNPGIKLSVLAETELQMNVCLDFPEISRIYADCGMNSDLFRSSSALELCRKFRSRGTEVFFAMPHIFREQTQKRYEQYIQSGIFSVFDGILVRNYESFQFLKEHDYSGKVTTDSSLYTMNRRACMFWENNGADGYTLPFELNRQEIGKVDGIKSELILYSHIPVMISAQCIVNTVKGCKKTEQCIFLTDRTGSRFPVKNRCADCYNVIYNTIPLCLFSEKEAVEKMRCGGYRIQFTVENPEETKEILTRFRNVFLNDQEFMPDSGKFTRGHFRRGIT